MRCSLLALSSYLDAELDAEPTGELEAHLLACDRCRTAIEHLREESQRIGGLARVHIPDRAVHELFSQIGLIEEGDELPVAAQHHERPASLEAPPWFGAERGKALPWAPRGGYDSSPSSEPRELIGGRSHATAVADPPELFLWEEPMDQIVTSTVPTPPPVHTVPARAPEVIAPQPGVAPVQPPASEPQPPDLSTSAPHPPVGGYVPQPPQLHGGGTSNALHRIRDAVAVRLALRRGAGSNIDSGVEIVSGAGAPPWNQRAHPKAWGDSPGVVVAPEPPVVVRPIVERAVAPADPAPTSTPELAEVLGEVATLAAPLGRTPAVVPAMARVEVPKAAPPIVEAPAEPEEDDVPGEHLAAVDALVAPDALRAYIEPAEPAAPSGPGRHVRRLHSQKPERRDWNPTQPVTGRHVLPIGGPAVAAADRDRRLWIFGAITVVVLVFGLLIGRTATQTGPLAASTIHRPAPTAHVSAPAVTAAPLPVGTPVPAVTIPAAPTPQQLTGSKTLGTGSSGFTVADIRIGQHPNDFRLVFDLAFPDSVTGAPATVVGYDGPTTLYVEFTGVDGTSPVETMPPGQVVVSVEALPMARNTSRLIFKITLRKNAPFDAYYLSGGRLIIDVT